MKRNSKKHLTKAGWLLFYLYIIVLIYYLFFSERYGRENVMKEYHYNLEFFKEIKRFIRYRHQLGYETFIVNIFGNIAAFVPFGFILPLLESKYRRLIYTTFLSFIFSLCAEALQLFLKVGIFDVDDIMMNTLGGILGYLSFLLLFGIYQTFHRKKRKQPAKKPGH